MTLFDVARKNIRGNFKNYLVYFVSMLFSVVIYYTFVSLQHNTEIAESIESSKSMKSVFMAASVILILFVAVFIFYSNQFFTQKRKKEAGIYLLLGLPKKTVRNLLIYENLLLGIVVLFVGIALGAFLSKLFAMILLRLLGSATAVGMNFSLAAVLNTIVVFAVIFLITSFQSYRLVYRFKLIELFRAEQEGEQEPGASWISAIIAVLCILAAYVYAFRSFSDSKEILTNLGVMIGGIIVGTVLLFSSLVIFILKLTKRRKKSYYKGMNLVSTSNLVYRIKGNARMLSVISLLSAAALCAFSIGFGMYYGFEKTSRLAAPFSYMFIAQDDHFNQTADKIIRSDQEHPVDHKMTIPVIKVQGEASKPQILSEKEAKADERPIKVISLAEYNRAAQALGVPQLNSVGETEAIAIQPLYTDRESSDYEGESITLQLPKGPETLSFAGMTVQRVLNWSYPDVMIIVNEETFRTLEGQISPEKYIGYIVQQQKTTKTTADLLAVVKTPESKLLTFYSEYRLGIEDATFNVFILGFLGLIFVMATGSIIYFKQVSEAVADTGRYSILRRLGVSSKEIRHSILKQNAFVFLLPLAVALAHYMVILQLLIRLFSSLAGVDLTLPFLICAAVFILIYAIYFALTVNAINGMALGESARMVKGWVAILLVGVLVISGMFVGLEGSVPQEKANTGAKIQLELPKPTGKYPVGTAELHLVDEQRPDPWKKDKQRELMVSIWYPAEKVGSQPALYMHPEAARIYDEETVSAVGIDPGRINWAGVNTHAWLDVPVARNESGWPVILYSPGGSVPRTLGTVLVEELASRGYIVVTVDHTYDASVVAFPDGRVETGQLPDINANSILKMLDVRVNDMRFVLDQLANLNDGVNPDYEGRTLPAGLQGVLDLSKIGIFGHSAGGATAAQTMYEDSRLDAGIDMDGTMGYMPDHPLPVAEHGLDRPFLLINGGYNDEGEVDSHLTAPDRKSFWQNSNGWKRDISIPGGAHYTFTDYQYLLPALDGKLSMSPQVLQQVIGSADPDQVLDAQRKYVTAFFDLHLKGANQPLFDSSTTPYPEVRFVEP
ncbi:FtsX-like permease family protein [Paenibacillus sp. P96]|uniref:FtsX-like permease family protein n=1 Tax=Paenibacillus zeirhizosphaerae TaxID=2987519 RepID=A0ABT9FR85_9BACL|nr:FtsX-like permease family protein [Paenibacillus sp. P96]MDP4097130.1 FtsX-like permease family protein [Paenibacillus sp. P96]